MYWKCGTITYIIITKYKISMWIINDHNSLIYTIKFINTCIRKFIHKKMKLRKYKIYPTSIFNYPIMHHSGDFLPYNHALKWITFAINVSFQWKVLRTRAYDIFCAVDLEKGGGQICAASLNNNKKLWITWKLLYSICKPEHISLPGKLWKHKNH